MSISTYHRRGKDLKKDGMIGRRFGRLVILKRGAKRAGRREIHWLCECDCGRSRIACGSQLRRGKVKSCGCAMRDFYRRGEINGGKVIVTASFHNYKSSAANRGLEFSITKTEFEAFTSLPCTYCGAPPKRISYKRNRRITRLMSGLDRVDNLVGYTKENVVSCCFKCNEDKMGDTVEDFLSHVHRIAIHQGWIKPDDPPPTLPPQRNRKKHRGIEK